jgi:hypothetical protein
MRQADHLARAVLHLCHGVATSVASARGRRRPSCKTWCRDGSRRSPRTGRTHSCHHLITVSSVVTAAARLSFRTTSVGRLPIRATFTHPAAALAAAPHESSARLTVARARSRRASASSNRRVRRSSAVRAAPRPWCPSRPGLIGACTAPRAFSSAMRQRRDGRLSRQEPRMVQITRASCCRAWHQSFSSVNRRATHV